MSSKKHSKHPDLRCAPTANYTDGSCIDFGILKVMVHAFNKYQDSKMIENFNVQSVLNNINSYFNEDRQFWGKFIPERSKSATIKYVKSHDKLETLCETYNRFLQKIKIKDTEYTSKMDLVHIFQKKCKPFCRDQVCWVTLPFVEFLNEDSKEKLTTKTFRPPGPKSKNDWLSTTDINLVLDQYEDKYVDFKYLGTVPLDFQNLPYLEIAKLDFNHLLQTKRHRIGSVINLDYHNQSGSHWVALYADLLKREIYYFDSYGTKPKQEIVDFIKKVKAFCDKTCEAKNMKPDTVVKYNRTRHQYENSECGVYSINMILRMLKGVPFDKHNKSKIKDKLINRCRYKYFSNRIQGLDE